MSAAVSAVRVYTFPPPNNRHWWGSSVGRRMAEERAGYDASPQDGQSTVASLDEAREVKERRARVRAALRTGEHIASADQRDREYQRIAHRGLYAVLSTAARLTSEEYRYLLALLAHSDNQECEWATLDPYDTTPPTLVQWAAWLHMGTRQQVNNIRASLHAKNIIRYVDGKPAQVSVNTEWETWDQSIFEAHKQYGCKPTGLHATATQKRKPTGLHQSGKRKPTGLPDVNPLVYNVYTGEFTRDGHEAGNEAAPEGSQKPIETDRDRSENHVAAPPTASHDVSPSGASLPSTPSEKPPLPQHTAKQAEQKGGAARRALARTTTKTFADDSPAMRLTHALVDAILVNKPDARDAGMARDRPDKLQNWAIPMDLLLRVDGRDYDRTLALIAFATTDTFWQANILSPSKFRQQWDTLDAQERRAREQRGQKEHAAQRTPRRALPHTPDVAPVTPDEEDYTKTPIRPSPKLAQLARTLQATKAAQSTQSTQVVSATPEHHSEKGR